MSSSKAEQIQKRAQLVPFRHYDIGQNKTRMLLFIYVYKRWSKQSFVFFFKVWLARILYQTLLSYCLLCWLFYKQSSHGSTANYSTWLEVWGKTQKTTYDYHSHSNVCIRAYKKTSSHVRGIYTFCNTCFLFVLFWLTISVMLLKLNWTYKQHFCP